MKRFRFLKSRKGKFVSVFVVLAILGILSLFIFVLTAQGAVRTWDGEGTDETCGGQAGDGNKWSCALNWSTDSIPGSGDIATFDNTSDKDATIDASFAGSVQGVDINSGYDGTITQSRSLTVGSGNFDQASGTWDGSSQNLDINSGSFTVSGGDHTATTGTWTLERNFTHSGGNLTMTGASVLLDGTGTSKDATITCTGSLGGTFSIDKSVNLGSGSSFALASGCTIEMTSINTDIITFTNNGTINHTGSTFNLDSNSGASGRGSLANSSSGTINYSGTNITIEGNLTQDGTWDLTGKTITFDGSGLSDDTTVDCTGSLGGSVVITKSTNLGSNPSFTLNSGCTITVTSINSDIETFTNNGTINHTGNTFNIDSESGATGRGSLVNTSSGVITYDGTNITIEGDLTQNGTWDLTGKSLTFDGTGADEDTILICGSTIQADVTINKTNAGGNTTLGSNCTISGDFTRTDGPVLNPGSAYTLVVHGDFSMSNTDNYGGANMTTEFGGTGNQTITRNAGTLSGPVRINKTDGNITQSSSLTLDSLTIDDGEFRNSGQTLTVTNGLTVNDTLTQGTANITFGTLTVGGSGTYSNASTGDIIVGSGGVANSGTMNLGVEGSCPTTDDISITSSSGGNQRSWTGGGTFNFYDLSVQDQGGTPTINAFSSTSVSGNGDNWDFYTECELPVYPLNVGPNVNINSGTTIRRQ